MAVGLALAGALGPRGGGPLLAVAVAALVALAAIRARGGARSAAWLVPLALAACALGLTIGSARVTAIDAGALDLPTGREVEVRGYVAAVPRREDGEVAVRVETPGGRLLVLAPEPVGELDVGAAIAARGTLEPVPEFQRDYLGRLGIRELLRTREIEALADRRGGLAGLLDGIRNRAERALASGTPAASSALLRGFVLGQDDLIAEPTRDDFKRSGLAHLLAVSGQNVVLLAVLAAAVMALLGVPIRARLVAIAVLIGVYVVVTGAGPSIQRAGAMGAAGIVAALVDRPRSRWYVLLLAAAITLAIDPRAAADVGWQLSFAAVVGILLLSGPLARLLAGPSPGRARRALAEGAALTIAATVATAPLMAFVFGTFSVVTLPANLLAVVAEAPVMWLGMLAGALGQLPWFPVEPVTWLAGLLAAYIAQVAAWFAAPAWAQVELPIAGLPALAGIYAALGAGLFLVVAWTRRRARLRPVRRPPVRWTIAAAMIAVALLVPIGAASGGDPRANPGLLVSVLDVGQGDSILLQPANGAPVLVDAGPPEAGVQAELAARGVDRLAALVITHPDSDHSGGGAAVLAGTDVEALGYARATQALRGAAEITGTATERLAAGATIRSGALRLRFLWPPPRLAADAAAREEPNLLSLVALARWHGFRLLLTGDAEAELAPVHPGDVDVLKVAHHGSEDAGLRALLAETDPELAVISVGADNPYGHPAPPTLADLRQAGVPALRTDEEGEIQIAVARHGWSVTR